jgi:hemolysin activation/secretion protein
MTKSKLIPLLLLTLSQGAFAQQVPNAGSLLQQLPPQQTPQETAPKIRIEEATAATPQGSETASILVNTLQVTGARAYSETELVAVARFTPGSELTMAELQAMATRITEHYRSHGYFVARAYLPAQDVTGNVVTIAVSEGAYGKVTLRNTSRLSDSVANGLLGGLDPGEAITIKPLEHRLLLLSDVPGVHVTSSLVPGEAAGTSDLIVDVTPGRLVTGSIDADNAGNPYTGEERIGATVNLNNPFGRGDVASLRVLTSGPGLRYGRASYQTRFGRATAGVAYSRLDYELGEQFDILGANGKAEVASVYGSYPLIRSRDSNLNVGLAYDHRTFQDNIDLFQSVTDRKARVATAQLYGNHHDGFGGGGTSTFFAALSTGSLDIQTPAAAAVDAATARTEGGYSKLWFNAARLQRVTDAFSLYAGVSGQWASKNLDASEKMVLGGIDAVRAYPQGEGFGDEGYVVDLEARLLLAGLSNHVPGQVHLVGFVDAGHITINKSPWYAGSNTRFLSGTGVGVTWEDPGNFAVRTYYARKLGNEDAISAPDKSGRFWIQAIKYF